MKYLIILSSLFLLLSCDDYLEYKSTDKVIPKTLDHFDELLYGEVIHNSNNTGLDYLSYMTDEMGQKATQSSYPDESRERYYPYYTWAKNNQITLDNVEINDGAWAYFYHKILMCNIIESEVNSIETIEIEKKNRIQGEIYFMRALSYYYLINLYGETFKSVEQAKEALGVPINNETSIVNNTYKRASLFDVYSLIESSLKESILKLEEGEQLGIRYRPNIEVANLLLSRVYLYQKRYHEAKDICEDLISNTSKKIEARDELFPRMFANRGMLSKDNASVLFSWGRKTLSWNNSSSARYEISDKLRSKYDFLDARGMAYMYIFESMPNKFVRGFDTYRYHCGFRIVEAYFNRAEACIEIGGADNLQQALDDVNLVRENRIAPYVDIVSSDKEEIQEIFRNEKFIEMSFEDVRWFDIRRWEVEITHKFNSFDDIDSYDEYTLKAGSPNYVLGIPLNVAKYNSEILHFERENTKIN